MLLPIDEYEFHQSPCYWVLYYMLWFSVLKKNVRQFTGDWSYPGMLAHPRRPQCPTTSLALPHDRNFLPPKDGHVLNATWPRMAQKFETDKMGGLKVVSLRLASEDTKAERPGFLYRNFSGIGSSHSKHRSIQPAAAKKMCDVPVPSLSHGENVAGRRSTPADHVKNCMPREGERKPYQKQRLGINKRLEASIGILRPDFHYWLKLPWQDAVAMGITAPLRPFWCSRHPEPAATVAFGPGPSDSGAAGIWTSDGRRWSIFLVGPIGPKNTQKKHVFYGDVPMIFHDPWMAWGLPYPPLRVVATLKLQGGPYRKLHQLEVPEDSPIVLFSFLMHC